MLKFTGTGEDIICLYCETGNPSIWENQEGYTCLSCGAKVTADDEYTAKTAYDHAYTAILIATNELKRHEESGEFAAPGFYVQMHHTVTLAALIGILYMNQAGLGARAGYLLVGLREISQNISDVLDKVNADDTGN